MKQIPLNFDHAIPLPPKRKLPMDAEGPGIGSGGGPAGDQGPRAATACRAIAAGQGGEGPGGGGAADGGGGHGGGARGLPFWGGFSDYFPAGV